MIRTTRVFARPLFLMLAAVLVGGAAVQAQPSTIPYQGFLTDAGGTPLAGSVALGFSLYAVPTGGTALWDETQSNVPLTDGVFSVMLGSAEALDGVDVNGPLFLGVRVDGGDELAPRVPLGVVPVSLSARGLADGVAVRSLNGLSDDVTIEAGDHITITEAGGILTIDAATDGSFALPFAGTNATSEPALQISDTGTQFGIAVSGTGVGALQAVGTGDAMGIFTSAAGINPALSAFSSGAGPTVQISKSGSGRALSVTQGDEGTGGAAHVAIQNPDNGASALHVETNGSGHVGLFRSLRPENLNPALQIESEGYNGLRARVTGACCTAGTFVMSNPAAAGAALQVHQEGLGQAINARGVNGDGIETSILSDGDALYAWAAGQSTGRAGFFESINPDNPSPAVLVTTNSNTVSTPALHVTHTGRGTAGRFEVTETTGPGAALFGVTRGSGVAIHGSSEGSGTLAVGVWAHAANGSNAAPLRVSQDGTGNDIAVFQSSTGVNRARIDRTGRGFFNGGTQASGADLAEAFEVEGAVAAYEPGDVLVVSTRTDRTVEKSREAYSTLVVGVYATKPGVLLTERGIDESLDDTVPMGVVGVLPTKVSGENGPIRRGDLLVTSGTPGHAMKAGRETVRVGTVLGKALENFEGAGTGVIRVLVNVK